MSIYKSIKSVLFSMLMFEIMVRLKLSLKFQSLLLEVKKLNHREHSSLPKIMIGFLNEILWSCVFLFPSRQYSFEKERSYPTVNDIIHFIGFSL